MGFRQQRRRMYVALVALALYFTVCIADGIILAEYAIHPPRKDSPSNAVPTIFPRYLGIAEQPVEIRGRDGAVLRATYAHPIQSTTEAP